MPTTWWPTSSGRFPPVDPPVPEILEVEYYRRAAQTCVGREVASIDAPDDWFLKRGTTAEELDGLLVGRRLTATRRRGKLLMVDTDDGSVLGLRFGMTGRLIVDGSATIDRLEYSPRRDDPAWDRFAVVFRGGGTLRLQDPRRLGGVELDPDEAELGVDAWVIDATALAAALGTSSSPLKARLMDQRRIAGLGNLLTDETLWRAGLAPVRAAGGLGDDDVERLASMVVSVLNDLDERGGSHTGDLHDQRHRAGVCPLDGEPLRRETVGGRTTYWCPDHQR